MANNQNSQISYTPPSTIDPTVAGYAARDPMFALGLMAGRYFANKYEQRGIDKLTKSVTDSDGNVAMPLAKSADAAVAQATSGATQLNQQAGQQAPQPSAQDVTPKPIPQVFAVNQNPALQSVNPYALGDNPLTGQPEYSSIRAQVMQKAINDAQNPSAPTTDTGDTSYRDSIMEKARAILNDDSNKWVQSANRGDADMALYKAGAIGNGINDNTANPYAIGNYDDPAKNYANMRQEQRLIGQTIGTPVMDLNGNVTMQQTQPVNLNNMVSPQVYQPQQSMFSQYVPNPSAVSTLAQAKNLWGNMENPQQTAVLDAVQQAKAVNPTEAGQSNNGDSAQPIPPANQQSQPQEQPAPTAIQTPQTQPSQPVQPPQTNFPQAKSPAQQLAQNIVAARQQTQQPVQLRPFNTQDWVASVWREGVKQGRPASQIQAVINNLMPQAQAAEQNYKDSATAYYMNNIFNPSNPLIPTASNYAVVMPKLMNNISNLAQVNPEAAQRVLSILPGAKDAWSKDVADQTLANREAYAEKSAGEQFNRDLEKMGYGAKLARGTYKFQKDYDAQLKNAQLAQRYNQLAAIVGPQEAAARVYGGFSLNSNKGSGTGAKSGGTADKAPTASEQKALNGYKGVMTDLLASVGNDASADYRDAAYNNADDFMGSDEFKNLPTEYQHDIQDAKYLSLAVGYARGGNYEDAIKFFKEVPVQAYKELLGVDDPIAYIKAQNPNITDEMIYGTK